MIAATLFDIVLCLLLVGVALSAIVGGALFMAIAFFLTFGLLMTLAWLRLDAIDVALAEAGIGTGLTGILLIGAWSMLKRRPGATDEPPVPLWPRLGAALASAAVAAMLAAGAIGLGGDQPGLNPLVQANLSASGVENPVTAVLLNFRAFDTLMESVVLLIALIAIWALTPDALWGRAAGLRQHARSDGMLATFGRFLPPLGLLVGMYIVWAGSDMPGGAFQAGTILAAVWLMVTMAGIIPAPPVSSPALRLALVAGPGVFLAIGLGGALFGTFLGFPPPFAKALIVTIELALTLSIAATLALLVAGAPREAG